MIKKQLEHKKCENRAKIEISKKRRVHVKHARICKYEFSSRYHNIFMCIVAVLIYTDAKLLLHVNVHIM